MKFKAVITEEYTEFQGTTQKILTGLAWYANALKHKGIPDDIIKKIVEIGLMEDEELDEKDNEETILDNDKAQIQVQKIDLNNMTKEEAKELLAKEIFKLFD